MIASIAVVTVLVLASFDSIRAELTPGTFTVIFSAMFGLMRPLKALTSVTSQFQRGMAASTTLFGLMDLDTEQKQGTLKPEIVKRRSCCKRCDVYLSRVQRNQHSIR